MALNGISAGKMIPLGIQCPEVGKADLEESHHTRVGAPCKSALTASDGLLATDVYLWQVQGAPVVRWVGPEGPYG